MSDFTVTVVGTGAIGTSIGLALKQQNDPPRVLAHDKDLANAKAAVKMGAFDKAEWNLINACEPADLIILATPLAGVRQTLEAIAPYLKEGVVISDTATSKAVTLAWADELLPDHAHFVGGNPVVHPPGAGHEHAAADLFAGRLYCLTPAPSADEDAVQLLVNLIGLLKAEPFFLDAAEHDGLLAATEHLPALLSVALLKTVTGQESWRELRKLAGKRFEQVTAGAVEDPDTLASNFLENSDTLLRWLDRYVAQLNRLRAMLANDATDQTEPLAQIVDEAVVDRVNWLKDLEKGDFTDPELVAPKVETPGLLSQMIGFGRLRRRGSDTKE